MEQTRIYIPTITTDEQMGNVLSVFFDVISQIEEAPTKDIILDFQYSAILRTSFIVPLVTLCANDTHQIHLENTNHLDTFLRDIHFSDFVEIKKIDTFERLLKTYETKVYTPICRFTPTTPNIDSLQSVIERVIVKQTHLSHNVYNVLSYIFSELVSNISEHSDCKYGYIFTQCDPSNNILEICIMDDGRTIYGSYVLQKRYLSQMDSEATALRMAILGYSTKDLPQAENRGYGISSSLKMVINGLKGTMVILSGTASVYFTPQEEKIVNIPEPCKINGTMIVLRIPAICTQDFDYKQYMV